MNEITQAELPLNLPLDNFDSDELSLEFVYGSEEDSPVNKPHNEIPGPPKKAKKMYINNK